MPFRNHDLQQRPLEVTFHFQDGLVRLDFEKDVPLRHRVPLPLPPLNDLPFFFLNVFFCSLRQLLLSFYATYEYCVTNKI